MYETEESYSERFKSFGWILWTIPLILIIAYLAPYQISVLVWQLSKITLAAFLGYQIDRQLHKYARPHMLRGEEFVAASLRRGLIVAATIIGLSLGV